MEPIRQVLVAIDLSSRSPKVLDAACRVAADPSVQFRVLHVVRDLAADVVHFAADQDLRDLQADLESRAMSRLREFQAQHMTDRRTEVEVRSGTAWQEILAASIHDRADLVVVGAHFHDDDRSKPVTDVVSRVSQMAPCPVLVVPTADE